MITLHYFPGNASMTPHILLRELGLPHQLQLVDRAQHAQKSPAYLALNPNGPRSLGGRRFMADRSTQLRRRRPSDAAAASRGGSEFSRGRCGRRAPGAVQGP